MAELDGPRLEPRSGAARQLVVFLHGYGADGNDLIEIGRAWQELLPHAAFVSPHAPRPATIVAKRARFDQVIAVGAVTSYRTRPVGVQHPSLEPRAVKLAVLLFPFRRFRARPATGTTSRFFTA